MRTARSLTFLFASVFFAFSLCSCEDDPRNGSHASVSLDSIKKGRELAGVYCRSCHQLPDPSWLNAGSWEKGVLPQMGPRLGIFQHQLQVYPASRNDRGLPRDFYPQKPLLSKEDWQHILD